MKTNRTSIYCSLPKLVMYHINTTISSYYLNKKEYKANNNLEILT